MKLNNELAVIFKINYIGEILEFVPIDLIEGVYNEETRAFIDKDGTNYYHIIEAGESHGYAVRGTVPTAYKFLPLEVSKK